MSEAEQTLSDNPVVEKKLTIAEKIMKAKELIGVVKRDGKVSFKNTNYSYQKAEDIDLAVREALNQVGLLIIPAGFHVVADVNNIITTIQRFQIMDAETGEAIFCEMGGQGQDSGDKRIYKAETGAYKYLQKQLFQIPAEESDPDLIPSEAYTAPTHTDNKNLNWRDFVPKTGKYAGKRLEDIAKTDMNWVTYWSERPSPPQAYCLACLEEVKK